VFAVKEIPIALSLEVRVNGRLAGSGELVQDKSPKCTCTSTVDSYFEPRALAVGVLFVVSDWLPEAHANRLLLLVRRLVSELEEEDDTSTPPW
jgi:hypothetical protein